MARTHFRSSTRSERNRIRVSISASSTKPSASLRSPAESFSPRSWRSSKVCKRVSTAFGNRIFSAEKGMSIFIRAFCGISLIYIADDIAIRPFPLPAEERNFRRLMSIWPKGHAGSSCTRGPSVEFAQHSADTVSSGSGTACTGIDSQRKRTQAQRQSKGHKPLESK